MFDGADEFIKHDIEEPHSQSSESDEDEEPLQHSADGGQSNGLHGEDPASSEESSDDDDFEGLTADLHAGNELHPEGI